jgi:hypothetical protein
MTVKKKISYIDGYNTNTSQLVMCTSFKDSDYISLGLPSDREYDTNLGEMIRANDGSIVIKIIEGTIETVDLNISNPTIPEKNIIYTSDDTKEVHIVGNYLDSGIVIVGYVYSNSEDWTIVRDAVIGVKETGAALHENETKLSSLPDADSSIRNTVFLESEFSSTITKFVDGEFSYSNIAYDFNKSKMVASNWIFSMANGSEVKTYVNKNSEIYYAESSNGYVVAITQYNGSYYSVLFGKGEEAKANIITILNNWE